MRRCRCAWTVGWLLAASRGRDSLSASEGATARIDARRHRSLLRRLPQRQGESRRTVLSTLDPDNPGAEPDVWEKVVRKLRVRYMPPAGAPRPDEQTYDSLISHFETSLDRAAAAKPNPGRTDTFRRLNRTEYHNAVRDLLAVDVDVAPLLPKDDSSHGFDNITVGELSPTLLERYLGCGAQDQPAGGGSAGAAPRAATSSWFPPT